MFAYIAGFSFSMVQTRLNFIKFTLMKMEMIRLIMFKYEIKPRKDVINNKKHKLQAKYNGHCFDRIAAFDEAIKGDL